MTSINRAGLVNVVFCHLLNDFSGSPRVLKGVISTLTKSGMNPKLYIGSSGEGVLSDSGIPTQRFWYNRGSYKLITLLNYLISQLALIVTLLKDRTISKDAIIYANTLLPFGAGVYGLLTRRRVIYHVHEISITPTLLRAFLCWMARLTANKCIFVSKVHLKTLNFSGASSIVVYNALPAEYSERAERSVYQPRRADVFTVLMLASLRDYKGIPEFIQLAQLLSERSDIAFKLVLNDDPIAIENYLRDFKLTPQVSIFPKTNNPGVFYEHASLVLNLSRVDQCVETFGLTVLEAMAFGIPVVVPPIGGPSELVFDSVHGYQVDSRDLPLLLKRVTDLADSEALCLTMSAAARMRAREFSNEQFEKSINKVVEEL